MRIYVRNIPVKFHPNTSKVGRPTAVQALVHECTELELHSLRHSHLWMKLHHQWPDVIIPRSSVDHASCYTDNGLKTIELVCGQSSKNSIVIIIIISISRLTAAAARLTAWRHRVHTQTRSHTGGAQHALSDIAYCSKEQKPSPPDSCDLRYGSALSHAWQIMFISAAASTFCHL